MQKVTLKYEYSGEYGAPKICTVEFNSEGMTFNEFLEEIKRFALMIGYHPDTVRDAFNEE